MRYESRGEKLLPIDQFARRVAANVGVALLFAAFVLLIGIAGYHFIARLPWIDATLDASMILGGMGEVDPLTTTSAKLFASAYALFSGLVVIGVFAVIIGPFAHRMLHSFHADVGDGK